MKENQKSISYLHKGRYYIFSSKEPVSSIGYNPKNSVSLSSLHLTSGTWVLIDRTKPISLFMKIYSTDE